MKFGRFAAVSVVTVPLGLFLLWLFLDVNKMHPVVANLLAVTLATIPNYLLNRYWVWGKRSAHSLRREIAPFWIMAVLGALLSSALIWIARLLHRLVDRLLGPELLLVRVHVAAEVFRSRALPVWLRAPCPGRGDGVTSMPAAQRTLAEAARGFMPADEGLALFAAGFDAPPGPWLEVGSYCGKSALYLGFAAAVQQTVLFAVDHHRGSEENQAGWEHHEPDLVDPAVAKMDTLPIFRRTVHDAGLEGTVIAVVGDSPTVASHWNTPLSLLFIDGGHGTEPAHTDYEHWVPHVAVGGLLLIHDVFPNPADGGRPPFEIFTRAIESGAFEQVAVNGSLRTLRRVGPGI